MSEEKKQILKMVEDGKISAEEAMDLLRALNDDLDSGEAEAYETEPDFTSTVEPEEDRDETIERIKRYGNIPLWGGVILVVLGGLWMFAAMQGGGFGFWFYCSWVPFLLGVLAVAAAAGSRKSRWIFVNVKQAPGERPQRIVFGMPLPIRFSAWALRTFGHYAPDIDAQGIASLLDSMADAPADEAATVIDVHDDEDGEHVQIFIG